jgi:hypothetical protein
MNRQAAARCEGSAGRRFERLERQMKAQLVIQMKIFTGG